MKKLQQSIKQYFWLFVLIPAALFFILFLMAKKESLTLLPQTEKEKQTPYFMGTYADQDRYEQGSTISRLLFGDSKIAYTYTLKEMAEDPYAGLLIDFMRSTKTKNTALNIAKYNTLRVGITMKGTSTQDIYLKSHIEGITNGKKPSTYAFLRAQIKVPSKSEVAQIDIPLKDFAVPDWWYSARGVLPQDVPHPDLTKLYQINIQNSAIDKAMNTPVQITLSEVTFYYSRTTLALQLFIIYVVYLTLLLLLRFNIIRVGKVENSIVIAYNTVTLDEEKSGGDVQRLTAYIAGNYSNPDLTVEILAHHAGVSAARVPTLLKHKFDMNFKQYLNTIRINEAKRLLAGTDQQIVTIAHIVGYNNIPHFNRTFKQLTGCSPKQFRQNPQKCANLPHL